METQHRKEADIGSHQISYSLPSSCLMLLACCLRSHIAIQSSRTENTTNKDDDDSSASQAKRLWNRSIFFFLCLQLYRTDGSGGRRTGLRLRNNDQPAGRQEIHTTTTKKIERETDTSSASKGRGNEGTDRINYLDGGRQRRPKDLARKKEL